MVLYVQLEEDTNNVIGYSSNKVNDTDIEIVETEVEERFLNTPIFFRYNEGIEKFEFSEELKNKYIKEKEERISDSERIEILTKQLAVSKINDMENKNIIDMLVKQLALTKIEIMNLKGVN